MRVSAVALGTGSEDRGPRRRADDRRHGAGAAAAPPSGVTIGGSPYYLKFTSSTAVKNFLNSSGGTPGMLNASATNATTSSAGNFADQVLALKLSVDFSNAGVTPTGLGSRRINPGFPLAGWTVNQVLAAAMQVLAGNASALPPGQTVGTLTTVVSSLNNNYDAGILNLDVCGK